MLCSPKTDGLQISHERMPLNCPLQQYDPESYACMASPATADGLQVLKVTLMGRDSKNHPHLASSCIWQAQAHAR